MNLFYNNANKVFIIAELSANHGHKKETAIETIIAAKKAGADAIKLQTYTPDTMTIECDNEYFMIREGLWKGRTLYDLYKEAYTPWEWHEDLFKTARNEGLVCFSTPFDKSAVDFLEELNNPIYKIASFEIHDIPLIEYAASKGKSMILSTGIAELPDIDLAIKTCRKAGNNDITLLKCTSAYPAPVEEANLATIPNLQDTFGVKAGLSDHTLGITVPIVATTLGATVIEKHFILDKKIGGPDASFSLDLDEFSAMVKAVRETENSIGKVKYELSEKVKKSMIFGRSLFAIEDIKEGEFLTDRNVKSIRPGYGLHPKHYHYVLGKRAKCNISKGFPIKFSYLID